MSSKRKELVFRITYGFCFLALMLIDWSRGSQRGVVWEMTVNFTGVVMAVLLLTWAEWKRFLHPIYVVWSLLGAVSIPFSLNWWQNHQTVIYRDKLWSAVLSAWLLGYFVIYVIKYWGFKKLCARLVQEKSNLVLYIMLFWMFFSLNEDVWPIWYLLMVLLIVAMPREQWQIDALRKGMIDGIIVDFFVIQGLAFVFRPFDAPDCRYVGMYANTNMNALFYCIVLMAFLVRLYEVQKCNAPKWQSILLFLLATGTCGFLCLTVSRTGLMTAFVLAVTYLIVVGFVLLKWNAKKALCRILAFGLCSILMIPVTYSVARYLPPLFHHPIWFDGEYSEDKVHSWDPIDSEKYVTLEDVLNQLHIRTGAMKSHALELFIDEPEEVTNYQTWGVTLHDKFYPYGSPELLRHESLYSRLSIWEHYMKYGTLWGHSNTWGHQTGMYGITWHGQNAFVQLWFYYGIPAGILYLIWIIVNIAYGLKQVEKRPETGTLLILSMTVVFSFGLLEATWYPAQMVLFLLVFTKMLLEQAGEQELRHE